MIFERLLMELHHIIWSKCWKSMQNRTDTVPENDNNFEDVKNQNKAEHNLDFKHIPDHAYRI